MTRRAVASADFFRLMTDIMILSKPFLSGFDGQENNMFVCHGSSQGGGDLLPQGFSDNWQSNEQ